MHIWQPNWAVLHGNLSDDNGLKWVNDNGLKWDYICSALTTFSYCTQFSNTSTQYYYPGSTYPCEIYEAINAQIVNERSIVVITRGSLKNQTLVCGSSSENSDKYYCPSTYNDTTLEYKFYTAQSEAFTILLDHAVTASKICSTTSRHQLSRYACASELFKLPRIITVQRATLSMRWK